MKKALRIAALAVIGVVVLALGTLRLTGLEPAYIDYRTEEFARANRIARPGLWLKGEVVREPVKDWSFVQEELRGKLGTKEGQIQLETRTWYGIPHSVTIGGEFVRDGKFYVHGHSDPNRMHIPFPHDKAWTRNVDRDPRVRIKVGSKIYEAMLVLITDRAEGTAIMGRDPVTVVKGPDGKEHAEEIMHIWRVVQMHVPDYSESLQGSKHQSDEDR